MKSDVNKSCKKSAFTIVELLTVMSIIVILIGLLVPALSQVKKFAREVQQKAQLKAISVQLEFFNSEHDRYPDSGPIDMDGVDYCGAMKLAEAMVGKDLLGFHPDSVFRSNGEDFNGRQLYDGTGDMSARKRYLDLDNANAYRVEEVYTDYGSFATGSMLLCDVFRQVTNKSTGLRIGMPILYYKARPTKTLHDETNPDNSIYDYRDNENLIALGKPWDPGDAHKLEDPIRFYQNTQNRKVTTLRRPYNEDTYILITAGNDGDYGTADDICNYDFKYKEIIP